MKMIIIMYLSLKYKGERERGILRGKKRVKGVP